MKKSIFRLALLAFITFSIIFSISASAQVIVQNGSRVNNYARFDTAVNHAQAGDTLYLSELNNNIGSYSSYYGSGGLTINKELHIFGTGIHPDSTLASGISYLHGDILLTQGASHFSISGVYIDNIYIGKTYRDTISYVDINRCYISAQIVVNGSSNGYTYISNLLIRQNICGKINSDADYYYVSNCTVSNNIATEIAYFGNNSVVSNNVLIDSVGYYWGGSSKIGDLFENNYATIENNIILSSKIDSNLNLDATYKNNLTISKIINPCSSCSFSGNLVQSKDSIFTNFGLYDLVNNPPQLIRYNFHLKTGCKGIGKGSDGNDIGIYGGLYPWKDGDLPINPHIQSKSIGTTLDASGNLKVNVTVEAQQK